MHKHTLKIGRVTDRDIQFDCTRCYVSHVILKQWVYDRLAGKPHPRKRRKSLRDIGRENAYGRG